MVCCEIVPENEMSALMLNGLKGRVDRLQCYQEANASL
jgi:hypothetical protein